MKLGITLGPGVDVNHLVTTIDVASLAQYVARRPKGKTVHNAVMKWLDGQPDILERFKTHGVLKAYGAYLLEYILRLK